MIHTYTRNTCMYVCVLLHVYSCMPFYRGCIPLDYFFVHNVKQSCIKITLSPDVTRHFPLISDSVNDKQVLIFH